MGRPAQLQPEKTKSTRTPSLVSPYEKTGDSRFAPNLLPYTGVRAVYFGVTCAVVRKVYVGGSEKERNTCVKELCLRSFVTSWRRPKPCPSPRENECLRNFILAENESQELQHRHAADREVSDPTESASTSAVRSSSIFLAATLRCFGRMIVLRGVTGHICGGCATDTERRIFGRLAQISWQNFAE